MSNVSERVRKRFVISYDSMTCHVSTVGLRDAEGRYWTEIVVRDLQAVKPTDADFGMGESGWMTREERTERARVCIDESYDERAKYLKSLKQKGSR